VGQTRILRHRGDARKVAVKWQELQSVSGECDVAVQIREARVEKGIGRLAVETLGRPGLARTAGRERCRERPAQVLLTVSNFKGDASSGELEAALGALLPTPEAYLKAHGVPFDMPSAPQPSAVAFDGPGATDAERRLARQVTLRPQRLLWVEPVYHDPGHRVHHEGELEFLATVGVDGRLSQAKVVTPLSEEQERQVVRVLSLWRMEPARKGDERLANRITERTVFRID
jgi:hypothetical protein